MLLFLLIWALPGIVLTALFWALVVYLEGEKQWATVTIKTAILIALIGTVTGWLMGAPFLVLLVCEIVEKYKDSVCKVTSVKLFTLPTRKPDDV